MVIIFVICLLTEPGLNADNSFYDTKYLIKMGNGITHVKFKMSILSQIARNPVNVIN